MRALLFALICGCAATPRPFPLRDPFVVDTDKHPVSVACRADDDKKNETHQNCAPAEYVSPFIWDQVDNVLFARVSRGLSIQTTGEAANSNSLDEVADSSWFTNKPRGEASHDEAPGACKPEDMLAEATDVLANFADQFIPERQPLVRVITSSLTEQIGANRQDKLVMAGTANLVRTEEDFSGSIFPVLEAIEEQVTLLRLFGEMAADQNGVSASIGRENAEFGLGEISVVASGYGASDGSIARLGVLGPLRMDYSNNMAAVRAVARYLTRLLGEDPSN